MITDLQSDALRIEVHPDPEPRRVEVKWFGRSNSRNPGKVLEPYLQQLVSDSVREGLVVDMHFEELQYLNSSTVSCLIRFIRLAKDENLSVRLVYDSSRAWQRMSFDALRVFADGQRLTLASSVS